jgi:rRNA maturation protein Nop10
MKKILLSFLILAMAGYGTKLQAQCNIIQTNVFVQVVGSPVVLTATKCQFTINTQFDMTSNAGFKYLFFHSWLAADYPATPIFDCTSSNAQDPGTSAQLGTAVDQVGKSFLDYGFINVPAALAVGVPQTLTFATTYPHDPTVVLTTGTSATRTLQPDGTFHFAINNMVIIVNQSCATALAAKTDIWGTNSNAGDPKAQCYICAVASYINDPSIIGFKACSNPRQYSIGISTINPTVTDITYKVYLDVNGNGILETGGPDILAFTSGPIQISQPGGPGPDNYSSGSVALPPPYSNTQPYSEYAYFILVEGPTLPNSVVKLLPNPFPCAPLPVDFKSFTATRNHSNVMLKWETISEQNCSGFAVERNTNGTWEQVAFVASQAQGGNSSDLLSYQFIDLNNTKGISQYRIRQVDIDNRSKYSEVRSVRGDGQLGKVIVYPNPTMDGKVNVSFEDAAVIREVSLIDMSGRTLRQWKAVTSNNIAIENLTPGMYTLRVVVPETGEQVVNKIVVNKR